MAMLASSRAVIYNTFGPSNVHVSFHEGFHQGLHDCFSEGVQERVRLGVQVDPKSCPSGITLDSGHRRIPNLFALINSWHLV